MPSKPLVSVITPTYNRAHILEIAIQSILSQTYDNWEFIIVDDGSTDDTKEFVASHHDPRIKYLYKENGGPCAARNFGIAHAKGKWITYLDSDDILFQNCLEIMVKRLEANPDKVFAIPRGKRSLDLYENGELIETVDDSDDMPTAFTVKDIFMRNARFACLGFMHLRQLYNEGLMWDEQVGSMEDWEFMMTIGEKYPDGFLYVPEELYDYHQRFGGDGRCSSSDYGSWAEVFEYVYQKHKDDKMMKGQTWYPDKVKKWRKRQTEFEAGTRPAYMYHHFPKPN
jgi:glycosyltransferase involved in cell wall biosynthesis